MAASLRRALRRAPARAQQRRLLRVLGRVRKRERHQHCAPRHARQPPGRAARAQPAQPSPPALHALGVSPASSASTPSGRIAICQHGASVLSPSGPRPSTSAAQGKKRVSQGGRTATKRLKRRRAFDVVHQDRLQRAHLLLLLCRKVCAAQRARQRGKATPHASEAAAHPSSRLRAQCAAAAAPAPPRGADRERRGRSSGRASCTGFASLLALSLLCSRVRRLVSRQRARRSAAALSRAPRA